MIHIFAAYIPQMLWVQQPEFFLVELDYEEAALGVAYIQQYYYSGFTDLKLDYLIISILRCQTQPVVNQTYILRV